MAPGLQQPQVPHPVSPSMKPPAGDEAVRGPTFAAGDGAATNVPQPGLSSGMHGTKASKVITSAFDGLIRSSGTQSNALPSIARRVIDLWSERPGSGLRIDATSLGLDGEEGLAANESEGRWLLPAFMAGLRVLRLRPEAGAWDVLRLAEELCQVQPYPETLAAFRDWLWSDGAEGFEVELQVSFMEVLETSDSQASWEDWSAAAVRSLTGTMLSRNMVQVSARDVDVASLRQPFQMSLLAFQREAASGTRALSMEQEANLRQGSDQGASWADVEMDAVLRHPELRATIPPDRLARRIVSLLSAHCDIRLLQFLTSLAATDDPYSKAVLANLEKEPLGEILARQIVLDGPGTTALGHCLARAPRHLSSGLMHGLLERCAADPALMEALGRIAAQGGGDRMLSVLDPNRLNLPQALALARMLGQGVRGGGDLVLKLAEVCPMAVRCGLLAGLPPRALSGSEDKVARVLHEATPEEATPLLGALAEARDPRLLVVLGQAIQHSLAKGWPSRVLKSACEALVSTPSGSEALVHLARSSSASTDVRMAAIRSLERRPEILSRISRWSFREALLDPPEVRERLREVRKRDGEVKT